MSILLDNIKKNCIEQGVSLAQVEAAAHLTPRTIYRWELTDPGVSRVAAVARVLGVPIEALLAGSDPLKDLEALPAEALEADPEEPIKGQMKIDDLAGESDIRYVPAEYIP